jgi:UDP-2,3-diacylglucosamine pyrophosphatase LpxH
MSATLPHCRTVFISDVHLGSRHCHAAELCGFLERLQCERLYLVGDIVDL